MSESDESGKFSTDIAQDLIDQAMKSVDKARKPQPGAAGEVEVPIEVPPAPAPAEAAPAPAASATEVEELQAQLDRSMEHGRTMMGKLKDEHERLLRATADLENYKKRVVREKEELQKFGAEKLVKDFVPVYDNFDRALEAARTDADYESLKKGVEMMRKLFEDTLGKHGVKVFSAAGQVFDPNKHEAMAQQETTEVPPNHVAKEILKGFTLNERLIRPALVVVSAAPSAPEAPPAPSEAPAATETETPAEPAPQGDDGGKTES